MCVKINKNLNSINKTDNKKKPKEEAGFDKDVEDWCICLCVIYQNNVIYIISVISLSITGQVKEMIFIILIVSVATLRPHNVQGS